ncbi:MAG TPA: selenocysteine-specific translation elongation factor [Gemmatimonadaceae bacterium]|nr:selenocysteine-specific translation elongation factor [Gemmatimonadaceae bacterium]
MILGTAGHIDHGKTTLVKALTGVDTDRLPEEKRRGITIDLGFAPLELEGIGTIGIVDVPGHEAFVRTMVAGATGIDMALLVIAADEGVMPQTREHLAILDHLGVRRGVVALTKSDMVDGDWLDLVRADVTGFLESSGLAGARIVPVSATRGEGITELRRALIAVAKEVPPREQDDLFRMPIDRVFTVKGTGTVVTGTVWSGSLGDGTTVRILPWDRESRVRGLQTHGKPATAIHGGDRAAIALVGVEVEELSRGFVLVSDPSWETSRTLRAEVSLADGVRLGQRTRVRFHVGTSEVGARGILAGADQTSVGSARIVLDTPVVLRAGDRFVLRRSSPLETIGGGVVVDPLPPKRAKPWPPDLSVTERLRRIVDEAGTSGAPVSRLPQRLGIRPRDVDGAIASLRSGVTRVGGRLWASSVIDDLSKLIRKLVAEHHRQKPLDRGAPVNDLRARTRVPAELFDHELGELVESRKLASDAGVIRQPGFSAGLSAAEDKVAKAALAELVAAGGEPPSVTELAQRHGPQVANVMRFLERTGDVIQVEPGRFYTKETLAAVLARLRAVMPEPREYTPAELREALGTSRKFLIPLLEYCDRQGLTVRTETGRMWRGT